MSMTNELLEKRAVEENWQTDVVTLVFPSGRASGELADMLNRLNKEGRMIFQIIPLNNTMQVMIVSHRG